MKIQTPAWETLRRIGQSRIVGLTVLVPFIGYMILLNDQLVRHVELSSLLVPPDAVSQTREVAGAISKAARDRLYFIYFGLTGLGIGSILYSIFCPRIQKEHPADFIYIREEIGLMTERRATSAIEFLRRRWTTTAGMKARLDSIELKLEQLPFHLETRPQQENEREMYVKELMLMVYQSENWWNPTIRRLVAVFYGIGFICLIVPSAQVFFRIMSSLVSQVP
jgi:hypothetical protein